MELVSYGSRLSGLGGSLEWDPGATAWLVARVDFAGGDYPIEGAKQVGCNRRTRGQRRGQRRCSGTGGRGGNTTGLVQRTDFARGAGAKQLGEGRREGGAQHSAANILAVSVGPRPARDRRMGASAAIPPVGQCVSALRRKDDL